MIVTDWLSFDVRGAFIKEPTTSVELQLLVLRFGIWLGSNIFPKQKVLKPTVYLRLPVGGTEMCAATGVNSLCAENSYCKLYACDRHFQ
ncbi:hypothetical protein TNCV_1046981 [Trichonephila clavipes]|nr:hypothetical protein TNCV_1046981 [Trichonephila clavipes]